MLLTEIVNICNLESLWQVSWVNMQKLASVFLPCACLKHSFQILFAYCSQLSAIGDIYVWLGMELGGEARWVGNLFIEIPPVH